MLLVARQSDGTEGSIQGCCGKLHTAEVSHSPRLSGDSETHEDQLLFEVERHVEVIAEVTGQGKSGRLRQIVEGWRREATSSGIRSR